MRPRDGSTCTIMKLWQKGATLESKAADRNSGGNRTYQTWYRNAAAFCTASTFNLTNGTAIAWTP